MIKKAAPSSLERSSAKQLELPAGVVVEGDEDDERPGKLSISATDEHGEQFGEIFHSSRYV